jgi:hypothetical protein
VLIILIASAASVGIVTGLVFAPGSPGVPYLSPTYQAEKADFRSMSQSNLGTIYEVWYIQPKTGETNTTLIIVLSANSPNNHFYAVSTAGVSSPYGNFSATIGTGKTWLVLPAASCPVTPDPTITELVVLHADSPVGQIIFSFKCTESLGTIVLGNPHIVISQLAHSTTCIYNVSIGPVLYVNDSNATVWVHNMSGCDITLSSYYVIDAKGDVYSQSSWIPTTIIPGPGVRLTLLIGSVCASCILTGNPFTFQYVNRYVFLFVMSNNVQFQQNTGTSSTGESLSDNGYAFTSSTNVTLSLQNLGSTTINFVSYTINDTSGNYWQNHAWNVGPITPGAFYTANIAIGYGPGGCGTACTYNRVPGAFNILTQGTWYDVKIVTTRGNIFTFGF